MCRIDAHGLAHPPLRPIFEPARVTVQPFIWSFACYQFAMQGVIEATVDGDDEKNRLCSPIHYWEANDDYASAFLTTLIGDRMRAAHPKLAGWNKATRLNPTSGIAAYRDDPRVAEARARLAQFARTAVANLERLLSQRTQRDA